MLTMREVFPAITIQITSGDVELRGINDQDIISLADLAQHGIHDPGEMPFVFPWTDAPKSELPIHMARYYWRSRSCLSEESWDLHLSAWHKDMLVGTQSIFARDFRATLSAETGSWLGKSFQGKGIGTHMRRAVCAFLFDALEATQVTSTAFTDNLASLAVSRKVGFVDNGQQRCLRRGKLALASHLVLSPDNFQRGAVAISVCGLNEFRRAIGLVEPIR